MYSNQRRRNESNTRRYQRWRSSRSIDGWTVAMYRLMRNLLAATCGLGLALWPAISANARCNLSDNQSLLILNQSEQSKNHHPAPSNTISRQPNGPFLVLALCEMGFGCSMTLVCYRPGLCEKTIGPDGAAHFSGWRFDDRIWQQARWSSDVTGAAWSCDGGSLFVSTSDVYGSGALFQIELEGKVVHQLLPKGKLATMAMPGPGYIIIGINPDRRTITYYAGDDPVKKTLDLRTVGGN